jgi:hypothetical protein
MFGELVHARGGGRAGRAHHFVAHRIDRADVVDDAVGEVHRQLLALGQHVLDALVRGVAAGEHLAVEQQRVAGLPAGHFFAGQRVQVDAPALVVVGRPVHVGPQVQAGRVQVHGARAVQREVRVARGGAVGDHGHRLAGRVRGVHLDLDVQHRGQAAQALRANAQRVDLFVQLDAQLFLELVARAAACSSYMSMSSISDFPWPSAWPSRPCRRCRCPACPAGTSPRPWWARS